MKLQKGFTIVELLVVVAIFAVLLALVMVQFRGARARARDAEREEEIKSLQTALQLYATNHHLYPPSTGYPYNRAPLTGTDQVSNDLRSEGTLSFDVPSDPLNTAPYQYEYESLDGLSYTLYYSLETDSIPGKAAGTQTVGP